MPRRSIALTELLQELDSRDAEYLQLIQSRIRKRRKELGWTQEKAAEQLGIGLNWYQQLESKQVWRFNPTLLRLIAVARKMGLEPAELLAPNFSPSITTQIKTKKMPKI